MHFSKLSIDEVSSLYPSHYFEALPFPFHPDFLKVSEAYVKSNTLLFKQLHQTLKNTSPYYIQIQSLKNDAVLIPVLRIEFEEDSYDFIPFKKLQEILSFQNKSLITENEHELFFKLSDMGYNLRLQKHLAGWNLSTSLFSIFNFFPEEEQKEMAFSKNKVYFKPLLHLQDRKQMDHFYNLHIEKNINFPALMKRPQSDFFKILGDRYSVLMVYLEEKCVGFISFVKHLNKIHTLYLLVDSSYKNAMPLILFQFFKWAHERRTISIDTVQFEWCLLPFLKELLPLLSSEILRPFYKKAVQMQQRMLKEI
ncbi:MAG: hypothetical protein JNK65_01825 [Deltaproteobacteria bacterium]|nr:hypothetical protein [Deltaproteobacteria bacterium]